MKKTNFNLCIYRIICHDLTENQVQAEASQNEKEAGTDRGIHFRHSPHPLCL